MAGGVEVPPEYLAVVNVVGIGIAIALAAWRYARALVKDPAPPPEVQVVGGAMADRSAMMRLAESIDRIGDLMEDQIAQRERHHAADDLAVVHRRLDDYGELRRQLEELSRRLPP